MNTRFLLAILGLLIIIAAMFALASRNDGAGGDRHSDGPKHVPARHSPSKGF